MRRFGLIGKTLSHSFSKNYFTRKFAREHIDNCRYDLFELQTIEDLPAILLSYPDLEGLNVTIPYKQEVIPFLDEATEVVKEIGACNCIKISGGKLKGFNTDVIGFKRSLESHLLPGHDKALILGTGGAAKAVQYALKEMDIEYKLVSRRKTGEGLGYEDIGEEILNQYTLIINTTPLGMYPNVDEAPPIPYQYLSSRHLLFDLIYNPAKTKFLQNGEAQGARIANGHEMLILQAEESWRIWNGRMLISEL
jgi:shikimate dehydrogenase